MFLSMLVSLIEVALDAPLRSTLKILRHEFHLSNLRLVRNLLVDFRKCLLKLGLQFRLAESVQFSLVIVRVNERYQCSVILDDKRIHNIGNIIQDTLDLLRINILSGRSENHTLGTSLEEQEALVVHNAHISCMEPPVLVHDFGGSL